VPVACQGHTSGHNAYLFPDLGIVATGDALVTGHPLSSATGPQLLPSFFSNSQEQSLAALDVLGALEADVLLPGHGDPWRGDLSEAAAMARRRAARPSRER
jgi:glyoxylase-like metal-dependent hydrolase (beta-lactamase superfamily II)